MLGAETSPELPSALPDAGYGTIQSTSGRLMLGLMFFIGVTALLVMAAKLRRDLE